MYRCFKHFLLSSNKPCFFTRGLPLCEEAMVTLGETKITLGETKITLGVLKITFGVLRQVPHVEGREKGWPIGHPLIML